MLLNGVKEIETNEGKQMIIDELLIINNPKFEDVFGKDIKRVLDGNKQKTAENFNDYKIIIFGSDFFILETENKYKIDIYRSFLDSNFKQLSEISSEIIDLDKQIPENSGYFSYLGKEYLVIYNYNKLTDEINSEKGIYKGVIIEPDKYFEVNSEVQNVVSKVEEIL